MIRDILPDIHGQADKLRAALADLGYRDRRGAYRHDDPARSVVFLGDFIDRGPDNAGVIDIARRMMDAGTAQAVMGNHELNALQFHRIDPDTGAPLRERSAKNTRQHAAFLAEFPLGTDRAAQVLDWMAGLPVWLDLGAARAVHACWSEADIATLAPHAPGAVLTPDALIRAGRAGDKLHHAVEVLTKGPELPLPDGAGFTDKDGHRRGQVRVAWWGAPGGDWRDIAISVPDPDALPPGGPRTPPPTYPTTAKPVFFGHYWLRGAPRLQAPNALCLDYSAGTDGPLVSYRLEDCDATLHLDRIRVHGVGNSAAL